MLVALLLATVSALSDHISEDSSVNDEIGLVANQQLFSIPESQIRGKRQSPPFPQYPQYPQYRQYSPYSRPQMYAYPPPEANNQRNSEYGVSRQFPSFAMYPQYPRNRQYVPNRGPPQYPAPYQAPNRPPYAAPYPPAYAVRPPAPPPRGMYGPYMYQQAPPPPPPSPPAPPSQTVSHEDLCSANSNIVENMSQISNGVNSIANDLISVLNTEGSIIGIIELPLRIIHAGSSALKTLGDAYNEIESTPCHSQNARAVVLETADALMTGYDRLKTAVNHLSTNRYDLGQLDIFRELLTGIEDLVSKVEYIIGSPDTMGSPTPIYASSSMADPWAQTTSDPWAQTTTQTTSSWQGPSTVYITVVESADSAYPPSPTPTEPSKSTKVSTLVYAYTTQWS